MMGDVMDIIRSIGQIILLCVSFIFIEIKLIIIQVMYDVMFILNCMSI